ncbi:ArsR/SmtB family transcription factor [Halarchaeum nitratireducens]|uniref:Transcriptional regulator n=1 Tax=Halarchaeum nitratireducens TaxID=489913 RepID=A0A830GCF1_9EURY|nr:winged helix-turn-helix domain-containing protein [Halarchaeum nitratireducens]MBP2252101.1 DNA-binding transcriptional ArsR family regulator [Halarchaeum solikamskense]GGN16924.1 transcriptional regulator [Halarchaeum nitratireducens]
MHSERVDDLLDALGDERSRAVLAALNEEPRSAKELANALDVSLPTVYRRLDTLEESDLVTAQTTVADDGNHYKQYACAFAALSIRLDGDEYVVDVQRTDGLADRFDDLWTELSGGEE